MCGPPSAQPAKQTPLKVTYRKSLARQIDSGFADATSVNICTELQPLRALATFLSQNKGFLLSNNISRFVKYGRYGSGRCRKQIIVCTSPVLYRAHWGSSRRQRTRGDCSNIWIGGQRLMLTIFFSLPNYCKRMGQKRCPGQQLRTTRSRCKTSRISSQLRRTSPGTKQPTTL